MALRYTPDVTHKSSIKTNHSTVSLLLTIFTTIIVESYNIPANASTYNTMYLLGQLR